MEVPSKGKNRVAIRSGNSIPGHIPRQNYDWKRYMLPCVHSSTIYKTWKQHISINRGMDKEDVLQIKREYYLAIKNEILPFTVTWMDLEITILSEVSQKEKDKYYMIFLICGT